MGKRSRRKNRAAGRETVGRETVLDRLSQPRQSGGGAVRFLPLALWDQRALFVGAPDRRLEQLTDGGFGAPGGPAAGTHPLYVLERVANLGHRVCPCSRKRWANRRFIPEGCVLEHTGYLVAETTYLVEDCMFQVPRDTKFLLSLRYWGRVPADALREVD